MPAASASPSTLAASSGVIAPWAFHNGFFGSAASTAAPSLPSPLGTSPAPPPLAAGLAGGSGSR